MSKELAERLEQLAVHLKGTVYLHPEHVTALDEAIAALRAEPASGQLSAEDIEEIKFKISIWSMRPQPGTNAGIAWEKGCWQGVEWGMALSSLRGTFADGIEARGYRCVPVQVTEIEPKPPIEVNSKSQLARITAQGGNAVPKAPK